jgi:hypothetical protein
MYAETLGIQNPSPAVEEASKWVQWSLAGVQYGAEKEDQTRYNLDQFWKAKAAAYPTASAEEQGQLERLDTLAHGVWDALETGKMYRSTPGYWDYLKAYAFSGVPLNQGAIEAAQQAAKAQAGELAAAQRAAAASPAQVSFGAGLSRLATQNQANLPSQLAQAQRQWKQPGMDLLGVPIWAWIAGAATIGLLLITEKR